MELIRYCQKHAGAPGHNTYGVPLHACNGYRHDEHYWAWHSHRTRLRKADARAELGPRVMPSNTPSKD